LSAGQVDLGAGQVDFDAGQVDFDAGQVDVYQICDVFLLCFVST